MKMTSIRTAAALLALGLFANSGTLSAGEPNPGQSKVVAAAVKKASGAEGCRQPTIEKKRHCRRVGPPGKSVTRKRCRSSRIKLILRSTD